MSLLIFLSDRCNMTCDYCFLRLNGGAASVIGFEAARRAVSENAARRPRGGVTILGGEPFLHYPLLQRLVLMIRARAPGGSIQIVTNGTLLTAGRIARLRESGAQITVSLDGRPSAHDRHRRLIGRPGDSSLDLVLARLPPAERRGLRINMVVGEDTAASLLGGIEFLRENGFENISFHLNAVEDWSDAGLDALRKSLDGLARYRRLLGAGGRSFSDILRARASDRDYSGSAHAYDDVILGADGRYYPCDGLFARRYAELGDWAIGGAESGVDWGKRARFHRQALDFIHGVIGEKAHLNCPRESYFRALALGRDPAAAVRAFRRADLILEGTALSAS